MIIHAPHDGETNAVTRSYQTFTQASTRSKRLALTAAVAAVIVCSLAVLPAHAAGADASAQVLAQVLAWFTGAPSQIKTFLLAAYDKAPALVMVLGALFVMPMTALLAYSAMAVRDYMPSQRPAARGWLGSSSHAGTLSVTRRTAKVAPVTVAAWPATAWLAIDGGARVPLPKSSGLIRIGRHEDNDIQLSETSVHRHHAIIHRTAAAEFVITDLSGATGNGVIVNGERVAQAQLLSADVVELGGARMTFESTPV
jgi:hypothetical protein